MKITAAATGIPVSNLDNSIRFFIDTLGFSQEFKHEGTAELKLENCLILLWRLAILTGQRAQLLFICFVIRLTASIKISLAR